MGQKSLEKSSSRCIPIELVIHHEMSLLLQIHVLSSTALYCLSIVTKIFTHSDHYMVNREILQSDFYKN